MILIKNPKKFLICFKTHKNNDRFHINFNTIVSQISSLGINYDFLILNDNTQNILSLNNFRMLEFNKSTQICGKSGYNFWFRADLPLIYAYQNYPYYDYYYQIEYDCRSSEWEKFFLSLENLSEDFLAPSLKQYDHDPFWSHWNEHNLFLSKKQLIGSYFPIVRISRRAMELLINYYIKGYKGYCELIVPSIIGNYSNMIINDLNLFTNVYIEHFPGENLTAYKPKYKLPK